MTTPTPEHATPPTRPTRPAGNDALGAVLVIAGAVVGAVLGYFAFFYVLRFNLYALVLPGGLCALGATFARTRWIFIPFVIGIIALFAGLYTEFVRAPFIDDASLGYFLTHAWKLTPLTQIMIVAGTILGFVLPFNRRR